MKLGVIPSHGAIYGLIDHLNNVQLGDSDVDALIVEHPQTPLKENQNYINTSIGLQTFLITEEVQAPYMKAMQTEPQAREISALYSLFNGETFSDWLEVSYSCRFMNNDVGPKTSFTTGVGLKPEFAVEEAVKGMAGLKQLLKDCNYKGEVYVGISKEFKICNLKFGHIYSCFAMFYEVCKHKKKDGVLRFLLGESDECGLTEHIVISNVVSKAPYPYARRGAEDISIPTRSDASKHIWRVNNESAKYVLVLAQGDYLLEARRRIRRTLTNMTKYDRDLQYRTDYGLRREFVLGQERYKKLAERDWEK